MQRSHHQFTGYLVSITAVLCTAAVRAALDPIMGDVAPLILFLLPVAFSAWYAGFWPGVAATVLGMVLGITLFASNGRSHAPVHGLLFHTVARGLPFFLVGVVISLFSAGMEAARSQASAKEQQARRSEEAVRRLLASEQALRETAERASGLKDQFLATLSHELRTPLNAIVGWSQILKNANPTPADIAEGVATIERNARAQAQIIEDLLDMSRIISGKVRLDMQPIDLASAMRAGIDTVRPSADAKQIRLDCDIGPLIGVLSGDPNRLHQIFWNLLTNAVKFTPRGGQVRVIAQQVEETVEVSVIDNGEGITPEFLPHVFDRFRQADSSTTRLHGGLGIGLSIVKQLAELHGGSVRACSDGPGAGSRFTLALPLGASAAPPRADEPLDPIAAGSPHGPPPQRPTLAGVRVLVVDDEPDARALIHRLLQDCQAEVHIAGTAAEAIDALGTHPPDVLVSDIGMPEQDGFALIRQVRALARESGGAIPAVALTAYARPEDRVRAIQSGFQMHLAKPVDPIELVTIVASLAGDGRRLE